MKNTITFKLEDASLQCGVDTNTILEFISAEWIKPTDPIKLILDEEDIARIQLIWDLKRELGVNDESVPIILHLIDELNHLQLELKRY